VKWGRADKMTAKKKRFGYECDCIVSECVARKLNFHPVFEGRFSLNGFRYECKQTAAYGRDGKQTELEFIKVENKVL
jgi:hypothetical protein